MSDSAHPTGRTCEWCGSPMDHDGRAVCPSCGRLASRLAAMDEVDPPAPETPAAPVPPPAPPVSATPPPSPPPPAAGPPPRPPSPRPAPPAPAAPHPPSVQPPAPTADGPVAPGGRWPTPAPLPPEEEPSRPWWKIAVPAAVVVLLLGIAAVVTLGGGGDGGDGGSTAAPPASKGTGKVDLSGIEDPAATTTRPTTTSTTTTTEAPLVTTPEGRIAVESASGITWTMASKPVVRDLVSDESPDPVGTTWRDTRGSTTETVTVTQLGDEAFDADLAIDAVSKQFDGRLAPTEESHIEAAPGRTASFKGTVRGQPVVGYVVAAQVGDESLVISMVRQGEDLDGLYADWLALPSSVTLP